jgi:ABC-type sugar transport system substrate-binding protein
MALTQVFTAGSRPTATKLNESSIPVVTANSDIASPYAGQMIFNSTNKKLYRYSGSAWVVYVGGPTWNLLRTTAQTITPASTHVLIAWNSEVNDSDNMHATNATTVVITQAGLYAVAAKVSFTGGSGGTNTQRASHLEQNGSEVQGSTVIVAPQSGGTTTVILPTMYIQCAVGDTLAVSGYHNAATATSPATGAGSVGDYCLFTGAWLHD